jgi:hypothetical protein
VCPPNNHRQQAAARVSLRRTLPKQQSVRISRTAPFKREVHDLVGVGLQASGGSGVSWGPAAGIGQLGAVADSYIAVSHCLLPQPVFDEFDVYVGQRLVNICFELHP